MPAHPDLQVTRMFQLSAFQLSDPMSEELTRVPGLFRRWELADLILPGRCYRIETAGCTDDGTPVFAVYATPDAAGEAP